MPAFSYKAKDRKGEIVTGTLEADSRGAVNTRLQAMGYYPMSITGGDAGGATAGPRVNVVKPKPKARSNGSGGFLGGLFGGSGKGSARTAGRASVKRAPTKAGKAVTKLAGGKAGGKMKAAAAEGSWLTRRRGGKVGTTELAEFYRQMADLIGAGVPLVKALAIVKAQTTHPTLQEVLSQVNNDVQSGDTFALALERHAKIFSKLNCALVRAGETGGLLDQTLARIADFSESQEELRSKVKGALAYPLIMVGVGTLAVTVLLTYVMPKVLVIFKDLNQDLPLPTKILIGVSNFLQSYWWVIGVAMVVGFMLFRRYIATANGRFQFHLLLLKIPKFGDLLLKREIGGFARTLGSLLRNGVPILNALGIAGEVMSIQPIRAEIDKVPESITQGNGIAAALRASPLFPPVVVNMVAIGEETGQLPEVLLRVAGSYESQVERDIKLLTSFIEPIIILVLGLVVGAIVISMLLPIFSLDPTAGT